MGPVLSLLDANRRRNERKMQEFSKTKRGQRVMNSKQMVKYREKRLKAMQPDVDKRLKEEGDHTRGQQVWFSRYICNGRLRHWVLMTHGNKYELRRSDHIPGEAEAGGGGEERAGSQKFTYHVSPFTIDEQKRSAALAESALPDVDGFYVCLIGWSSKTKAEVDAACRDVQAQFGEYNLLWANCQHFLKELAERIVDAGKASDFGWFASNTKSRYQKTQALMPPPLEFLLKMQQQMQAMMQTQIANQQVALQNQLQGQIQQQTQMQIQNQIQLQMQNQIQMQMQNQMQMQTAGGMGA